MLGAAAFSMSGIKALRAMAETDFGVNTSIEQVMRMMVPFLAAGMRSETGVDVYKRQIYGIGFPPFRGGALRYIDSIGVAEFVALADKYAELGALYHPTAKLREMAAKGQKFFG